MASTPPAPDVSQPAAKRQKFGAAAVLTVRTAQQLEALQPFSDVTLRSSDDVPFDLHKAKLAETSQVLRKLLLDTPGEKLVPLEEDSKELAVLVEFLYAPDFAVAEATVRAAYHFSDKYDVPLLRAAASTFMQEALVFDVQSMPQWLELALSNKETVVATKIEEFAAGRLDEVVKAHPQWLESGADRTVTNAVMQMRLKYQGELLDMYKSCFTGWHYGLTDLGHCSLMETVKDRLYAKLAAARKELESRTPGLAFARWTEHMPATVKEPVGRDFGERIRMAGGGQWVGIAATLQQYFGPSRKFGFGGGGPTA